MTKILLIEDERILRENTCELLELYGYECITAVNGTEAISRVKLDNPDLIVCDIMVPYLNGYEIKAELNKMTDHSQIPFIFLSAKIERSDLRKGMDLGAEDYLTKPFKTAELINSIESRLIQRNGILKTVDTKVIETISNFISIAKHECNTPLNGIINLSEIILANETSNPRFAKEAAKAINKSGKRLNKTLNNLIDIVRLRHYFEKKDTNKHSEFEIKELVQRVLTERAGYYDFKKEIKTNFEGNYHIDCLYQDIEIIIFELFDNVFKFCPVDAISEFNISFSQKDDPDFITLTISNTVAKPVIFSVNDIGPFKQINRLEAEQQGSGLGLYLVKLIVEKYNGNFTIDKTSRDKFGISITLGTIKNDTAYP